jgi:hypothetical protein
MNTDPKNTNPIRALSHPELASPDTNQRKLYEVRVCRTDYLCSHVCVEAISEEEAKRAAEALAEGLEECEWKFADRDLSALEASRVQEGEQDHE